jgi:hypothetical protein
MQRIVIGVPWSSNHQRNLVLRALRDINVVGLTLDPLPPLYRTHVRYRREARDKSGRRKEEWLTAHEGYRRGFMDCEDLAAWRSAELKLGGVEALPHAYETSIGWHIKVIWPNGKVEDPSKILGMGE